MPGWARAEKSGEKGGDHNLSSHFDLEIEGTRQKGVTSVTGLENALQTVDFVNGNDTTVRSRVARNKSGNLVARRHYTSGDDDWVQYFQMHQKGDTKRGTASVILKNMAGEDTGRFDLMEVQPIRWKLGDLKSDQSGNLEEELELKFETVKYTSMAK
ncbi:MAG: phage tail protein [Myxococcales bacterium]